MSDPTPPGAPQDPSASTPPVAPPSAPTPPPPPGGGYAAGPPLSGNVAPPGFANNDDKMWALIAHFGAAGAAVVTGGWLAWVPPLVAMLVRGNESPTVRAHAVQALNFQITWAIGAVLSYVLFCAIIGFVTLPLVILVQLIFGIIAGIKANEGTLYQYPLSIPMIK